MVVPNTNSKMQSVKQLLNDSQSNFLPKVTVIKKSKSLDNAESNVRLKLCILQPIIHDTEYPRLLDGQLDRVHNPEKLTILCCVVLPLVAL